MRKPMKHLLIIISILLLSSPLFGQSFVSVGNSGTILTSSDGILWTKRTSGKKSNSQTLRTIGISSKKTKKRRRCPNGTRRNKKTGNCEPYDRK